MFRTTTQLRRLTIAATDGEIGTVDRLFFDDVRWTIRHIVVDTGKWLTGRKVLIAPASVVSIDDDGARMSVSLTREKVRDSPEVDAEQPVSRQKELELARYYGYVPNWGTGGVWGGSYYPAAVTPPFGMLETPVVRTGGESAGDEADRFTDEKMEQAGDPHLRSTHEVRGYHVRASDGDVGHVDDFVIDGERWVITHLILDTSNWPGGRSVVIPSSWVDRVEWGTMKIHLTAPVAAVRERPEQRTSGQIDRELEGRLRQEV